MVELARVEVDAPELAPCVVGEEADDRVLAAEGIPARAEDPLRRGELRGAWAHGLVTLAARAVEVPPVAAVGDEVELARRRPFGLQDRFVGTAGDPALRREVPIAVELADPDLARVPRHVRVFHVCQAIRSPSRLSLGDE